MKHLVVAVFAVLGLSLLPQMAVAQDFLEPNLRLSGECAQLYREYRDQPGAKAFALDHDRANCGWSAGYASLSQARGRAIDECERRGSDCAVVAYAGRQEGISVGGRLIKGECVGNYEEYLGFDTHRAFAVNRAGTSCGWAYGYSTVAEARDEAIGWCLRQNNGTCRVVDSR